MSAKLNSRNTKKKIILKGGKGFKNTKNYDFSIITVVKNSDKSIEKTIRSVLKQKKVTFEYIIIDGNSSDNTLRKIKRFNKKINYWCSVNDNGIYDAMNIGLKLANARVICFVNSDDFFYNMYALSKVKKYFDKKKADYLFGTVKRHYLGNNMILKSGFNKKRFLYNFDSQTSHSTGFFITNKLQKKIGLYNLKFKCSADYDLFFRIYKNKDLIGLSTNKKEIIGVVNSGGFSSKYGFWNHLFEESKIRLKNNQNLILILAIFINAIIKHCLKKIKITW